MTSKLNFWLTGDSTQFLAVRVSFFVLNNDKQLNSTKLPVNSQLRFELSLTLCIMVQSEIKKEKEKKEREQKYDLKKKRKGEPMLPIWVGISPLKVRCKFECQQKAF